VSETEVVRELFGAFLAQDRPAAERLLDADFVFTSPQDNRIGKAAFLARCFPTAERFAVFEIILVLPIGGGDVFVLYEYELTTGARYRNVELITVRGTTIAETQVFFGGSARSGTDQRVAAS
jgi:hypothetical protein